MAKKSARIDIVDYYRFVAAIMIILHHTHELLGTTYVTRYYVEFFFMLTGYFIFKHFQKPQLTYAAPEQKAKTALQYTWQRFKSLMPFVIPIVLISTIVYYCLAASMYNGGAHIVIRHLRQSPFEFLLFPSSMISTGYRLIGPIWYLSVMIILMPLVSYVAQSKRKYLFLAILIPLVWLYLVYMKDIIALGVDSIGAILRGGVTMFMGGVIYYITEWMKKQKYRTWIKVVFTILELGLFVYAMLIALRPLKPYEASVPILFFVLLLCLSGHSYTSKIRCKLFNFLGAISLPLFLWHYAIVMILLLFPGFGILRRVVLLFGGSIAISIIHYLIVTAIQKRRKNKKSLIFVEK